MNSTIYYNEFSKKFDVEQPSKNSCSSQSTTIDVEQPSKNSSSSQSSTNLGYKPISKKLILDRKEVKYVAKGPFVEVCTNETDETDLSLRGYYSDSDLERSGYTKTTPRFKLDLTTDDYDNQLRSFFEKINDIQILKIKGLGDPKKLEMFKKELGKLNINDKFNNLSYLDLSDNALSSDNFIELNDIFLSRINSLKALNLTGNQEFGYKGVRALARSEHMKNLILLNLNATKIGDDGVKELASSKYLKHLSYLNLTSNDITDAGIIALANSENFNYLTIFNLSWNDITDAGVKALADSEIMKRLTKLYLVGNHKNKIGDAGAKALADSKHITKLKLLELSMQNIGDKGVKAIANSEKMENLTTLKLSMNNIGNEGVEAIANSEKMENLTTLLLNSNRTGPDGAKALATSKHMENLTLLNLNYNNIGYKGGKFLADSQYFNYKIKICCGGNKVTSEITQKIYDNFPESCC